MIFFFFKLALIIQNFCYPFHYFSITISFSHFAGCFIIQMIASNFKPELSVYYYNCPTLSPTFTAGNLSSFLCWYGLIFRKLVAYFLSCFEASAGVGHSFLPFLMGLFDEGLCWLIGCYFYCESDYCCIFSFSGDFAGFYLSDRFWSFCYCENYFLFLNFVQHCKNLK